LNYNWHLSVLRKTETQRARSGKRGKAKLSTREDGAQTRQQLLEVAGRVFAEHGYGRATSKEICARAKTNIAAVNYHFDGKDGLYAAVLEEAHARLVSIDLINASLNSNARPEEKLRALLSQIVHEISRRDQGAWELRVLSREILAPTPMMDRMVTNQVAPKAKLASGLVAGILGLPVNHPAVSRSIINVMGPCIMLLIVSGDVLKKIFPLLDLEPESLVDHFVTYAMGGMKAVAAKAKKRM
jgi:TetR/AcrR family transcriptional regulator, regulator of cefoperazone and chloramphenicol sensitivity